MAENTTVERVSGQGIAAKAVEVATLAAGKAYQWGGKSTDGFDCSGFVAYVFKQLFPNAGEQYAMNVAGYISSDLFDDIELGAKSAGDIIIFPAAGGSPNHVGFVLDSEYWMGSQSSTGVARVKFTNSYWSARTQKFRRLRSISTAAVQAGRTARLSWFEILCFR